MKRLAKISWLLMAICLLALTACGGGAILGPTATVDTSVVFTQIASTALALQTQTVLAIPTATNTPLASPTPEATDTPSITDTPLAVSASATPLSLSTLSSSQDSCNNLQYLADVTIPDGYLAQSSEEMDKTWSVKNLGPCTWNENYALVYAYGGEGTSWNSIKQRLGREVLPGDTVNLTVTLRAPSDHGSYGAYFIMQTDTGVNFPPGQTLTIFIQVQ